jgi:hypothetical protein
MRRSCLLFSVVLLAMLALAPVSPAASAEIGVIRIVQDSLPHAGHNFVFTGELGRFKLDDDHDSSLPRVRVFEVDAVNGPFRVRQVPDEAGWPLVSITCSDNQSVIDIARHTATIHVAAGETISCVFINHRV